MIRIRNHTPRVTAVSVIVLTVILAACSAKPHHPQSISATSTPAAPSPATPPSVQSHGVAADTITIGTSGVRCLAGKTTAACVTAEHRGMVADGKRTFSFIRNINGQSGVEAGFAPGQHVTDITAGDLVLFDPGNCDEPNAPPNCVPLTIQSEISDSNSKTIDIGTISKAGPEGFSISSGDTVFDIPMPPPAQAGRAVYRPNPGQLLTPGRSITVREWTFALNDQTLTIIYPTGTTTVQL